VVSSKPRPHFTPGKDSVPILQEAGWAPGSVWTGGKSRPHLGSIQDRPARSTVAIPTVLPGSHILCVCVCVCVCIYIYICRVFPLQARCGPEGGYSYGSTLP